MILARDLGYISIEDFLRLKNEVHEVGRMLVALYERVHNPKVIQKQELVVAE